MKAKVDEKAEADRKARLSAAKAKAERDKAKADADKAKADFDKSIEDEKARRAVATQPPPQKAATPEVRHPQDACADRPNFISREICLGRECQRPEKFNLPFCVDRRARQNSNPGAGNSSP